MTNFDELHDAVVEVSRHVEATDEQFRSLYSSGLSTFPVPFFGNVLSARVITVGLNPVTALFLGAWILSEPITLRIVIGVALLITAIIVTTSDTRGAPANPR